jgi:hypothetical protein
MTELTELQDKANDAFYAWEIANNQQDLSDMDRMIWTAGWIEAFKYVCTEQGINLQQALG